MGTRCLHLHLLDAGESYGRFAVRVTMGAGAEFTFGAAQLAGAGQTLEIVTEVTHAAPDAVSRQVVRSVASAKSTVNYLGKVLVAKGADGTDGEQSVRAMLLDRTATANARPELEIYADDVKCAHGAAVGDLDPNSLFYLRARGIPLDTARSMLIESFVGEALDRIETAPRIALPLLNGIEHLDTLDERLPETRVVGGSIGRIEAWLERHRPDAVAVERVFAQHNVQTVMGTAQAAGAVFNRAGVEVAPLLVTVRASSAAKLS